MEATYKSIYFGILFLTFLIGLITAQNENKNFSKLWSWIICITISLFIGLRPMNVGTDTVNYWRWWNVICATDDTSFKALFQFGTDPILTLLFTIASKFGNYNTALTLVSSVTNIFFLLFAQKISKRENLPLLILYSLTLASFSCWNEQVNVIRNGLGMAFLVNFVYHAAYKEWKPMVIFGVLAILAHFSSIIIIGFTLCILIFHKAGMNWFYIFYFAALFGSYLGLSVLNFGLGDLEFNKVDEYTDTNKSFDYIVGFRPTFALYNTAFLAFFAILNKRSMLMDKITNFLLKLYMLSSGLFFLWFALPYSDRVGTNSWFFIPVIFTILIINQKVDRMIMITLTGLAFMTVNYII